MESTVEIEPSESRSECVGEKRIAVEDGDVLKESDDLEDTLPPTKRIRGVSDRNLASGDVKKVAEMVLVLAAMGKMRGGRGPTLAEKELMAEARDRLAKVCEGFSPKEVFPRDSFGGVIEDLGLNKLKEQRLGFRPPKISIADKLLLSKRKMEKAEIFSLPSTPHSSQRLQGNPGAAVESRTVSHPVQMSQLANSNHMSISSGNFQSASPSGHVTTSNSTPSPYQLPTSEIRPIVPSALPSSHLGSAAVPRVDRPLLRSDGRSNGSANPSQIQANYAANSNVRTPTWSVQPQAISTAKIGSDNKVPVSVSLKVEGAAEVKYGLPTQTVSRPVTAQTTGPLSQGTNHVQAPPVGNTHAEVGKIVQKLLQPRVSEHPTWKPPSRDYMNKALTCQMCMSTVTEIDSVLICDACEKGYHLKCLQTNQNGVPRGEWHCGKCLSLSNGKPLPPKYGRVMRNNTPKLSANPAAVPSTSIKKIAASDEKVGPAKITVNGNTSMPNVLTGVRGNSSNIPMPESKTEDVKGMQDNENLSSRVKTDDIIASGTCPNNLLKISHSACVSPVNSSVEKTSDDIEVELKPNSSAKLEMVRNSSELPQAMVSTKDGNLRPLNDEVSPLEQSLENHVMLEDSKNSRTDETSDNANQLKRQEVVCDNASEISSSTGVINQGRSSSDDLHAVNWVGGPIKALDDKIYYTSCHINGHVYNAMNHVLIRIENDKVIPSKLQAMWEDKNTSVKWVTVNRCYFPGDLPEAVGRPCGLENSEVYESNCAKTFMAGLIESPCEVLPPRKFAEETERRTRSGTHLNDRLPPLYLCKWIYDEAKGLFRDNSC
ncbi:hypothetical protein ACJIZ3_013053 [Penstemon smallii]|uniref:PHD finger protein n=1 Tax=Penstemon smallii TaxID=265156 RepID=A0ABD3UQB4_9LAMI